MEPLKYIYTKDFINYFSEVINKIIPNFNEMQFKRAVFMDDWEILELKQRMRRITLSLRKQLDVTYKLMINQVLEIINELEKEKVNGQSFEWMFLPEFIELYGLDDFKTSINAFETITQFTSCEFAVRPFIVKYPEKMMNQMLIWSNHKSKHVRRFASEGCRPRLPWSMALPKLKENPTLILPILKNLNNDEFEYVRRSVANNLNDIAKDNPHTVIKIAKQWIGKTKQTDKLVKHACRTLLKAGNQEIMPLFGYGNVKKITINNLKITTKNIKIGDYLHFNFQLENTSNSSIKTRLEYAIYYQKSNKTLSKKVYKISEKECDSNSVFTIEKRQSFKQISTRKFHLGLHQLAIIVNGKEFDLVDFYLN